MTVALEGGEWSAARPGRTLPRERPGTHFTGGWVDPRTSLNGQKISSPPRFNPGPFSLQKYHNKTAIHLLWPARQRNLQGPCCLKKNTLASSSQDCCTLICHLAIDLKVNVHNFFFFSHVLLYYCIECCMTQTAACCNSLTTICQFSIIILETCYTFDCIWVVVSQPGTTPHLTLPFLLLKGFHPLEKSAAGRCCFTVYCP